jgi:WD40 repeat protein
VGIRKRAVWLPVTGDAVKQGALSHPPPFTLALSQARRVAAAAMATMVCGMLNAHGTPHDTVLGPASSDPNHADAAAVARKVGEIREQESISALDLSPDGKFVAIKTTASSAGIHVWNWRLPSKLARSVAIPHSPEIYVGNPILKYSPDGHRLAILDNITGIRDQTTAIYIWNADSGELLRSIGEPDNFPTTYGLAFSQDQTVLSLYHPRADSPDNQLVAHSVITGMTSWKISLGTLLPWTLACSPSGSLAAIGGSTGRSAANPHRPIVIVDLHSHLLVREIDAFPIHSSFSHIAWNPGGTQIAAGVSFDARYPEADSLKIFAVATGELVARAHPPEQNVAYLAYGGAGKYLIVSTTGSADVITIWDSSLKSILQTIPLKNGPGRPISVSQDGHLVAVADDLLVSIWEIK